MQKIKLYPAPHLEVRVHVSDEMEADLRECRRMAAQEEDNGKDCSRCSWDAVEWMDTGLCELPAVWARILGVMQEAGAEAGQDAAAPVLQSAT